jgi:hypothetical protein
MLWYGLCCLWYTDLAAPTMRNSEVREDRQCVSSEVISDVMDFSQ